VSRVRLPAPRVGVYLIGGVVRESTCPAADRVTKRRRGTQNRCLHGNAMAPHSEALSECTHAPQSRRRGARLTSPAAPLLLQLLCLAGCWQGARAGCPCPVGQYCVGGTTCVVCTAAPGSYCAAGSSNGTGVPCTAGAWCGGGGTSPLACTATKLEYAPFEDFEAGPVWIARSLAMIPQQDCTTAAHGNCSGFFPMGEALVLFWQCLTSGRR
jgi:hypothetical protein